MKKIMECLAFRIEEAQFFTGDLRTPDGQVVYLNAVQSANHFVFTAAEHIFEHSGLLSRLNCEWGRNTVLKHIAGSLKMPLTIMFLHIKTAEALAYSTNTQKVFLILRRRFGVDPDLIKMSVPILELDFYHSFSYKFFMEFRFSALFLLVFIKSRELKWAFEALISRKCDFRESFKEIDKKTPSLITIQEDDLLPDRSYRTQPHWLFAKDGIPPFRTIVLCSDYTKSLPIDRQTLKAQRILVLSRREQHLIARWNKHHLPVEKRIRKDIGACIFTSVFGSPTEARCLFFVMHLLCTAQRLISICDWANARAFMNCENYIAEADAMIIISPDLDIKTISYQYSNHLNVVPSMLSTADIMLSFSSQYHQRWVHHGIRPGDFVNIGYPFDRSFELIRPRAQNHRLRLIGAEADFIICYFDESVQLTKYGLTSKGSYCDELLILYQLILDDPSFALIVKPQFAWNSPNHFEQIKNARAAALGTGRYLEMVNGVTRNIIFPAEAALAADIAIGHAIGGTAPLEAALAGVRSIMLNPYGVKSQLDQLYAKGDIVYSSLETAIDAIRAFRAGSENRQRLGDWSEIIEQFDPFHDGHSDRRLRELLENSMLSDKGKR
jgi:hypothetical protein